MMTNPFRRFMWLLTFSALLCLTDEGAFAASHLITIQQINPTGDVHTIICEDRDNAICQTTLDVVSMDEHRREQLLVGLSTMADELTFTFAIGEGLLVLRNNSSFSVKLSEGQSIRKVVELWRPPYGEEGLIIEPLVKNPSYFADLKVNVSPNE